MIWQQNLIFVGRMGDATLLAGVGLATTTINMMCFSLLVGLNGALETLVSQAFGMKELNLCGRYFNRGLVIMAVCYLPMVLILVFSEPILIAIG